MTRGKRTGAAVLMATAWLAGARVEAKGGAMDVRAALAKGINMDHIFSPYRDPHPLWSADDDAETAKKIREEEFAQVAKAGFTHVRLNLGRCFLQDYDPPYRLREEGFKLLDRTLDLIAKHGLAVIVDMHQIPVPPLEQDAAQRKAFRDLWAAIATRCRDRPQFIAYELLNEPRVENPDTWRTIMAELIGAIRAADPARPIVVTGGGWGGAEDLRKVGLLGAKNLVYTFHFYDPFVFTHQGATWTGEAVRPLRGIRYPLDPEQMKAGGSEWPFAGWEGERGKDQLREKMRPVFEWAKQQGVMLYCGEFGAIKREWTPAADRARWVADVRSILEDGGAGWSMWAYHAGFDLADGDGPLDPTLLKSLGLTATP